MWKSPSSSSYPLNISFFIIHLFLLLLIINQHVVVVIVSSQPLYTNSRWIVNSKGQRVKLTCVNWVSHMDVMLAEGLNHQPIDAISKSIINMGFNCVRLTWPLYLFTNDSLSSISVRQSFKNLGLFSSILGLQANNPSIVDLSVLDAYKAVVASLAKNNVMIILDNHISKPGWCCSRFDGNGFFGDEYFDPHLWIQGLTKVATTFKATTNVVGMSLRNELRGPLQNVDDWYRYMQKGAEAVHAANSDVLIILSGLSFDKDLSFLKQRPVNLTFSGKLVFEIHRYSFTDGDTWSADNANQACGEVLNDMVSRGAFVLEQGYPLFVSEFGVDQRGTNVNDNMYFNCFLGLAAELDFDWALWTLVGSYYLRDGIVGLNEYYGILDWNWFDIRNSSFLQRISVIRTPFQGPGYAETRPHKVIFHPMTGLCVQRTSLLQPLELGPCSEAEAWSYAPAKALIVLGTYFCLQADDKLGQPAKLGMICSDDSSKWDIISDSKMHLSSKLQDATSVCLDVDPNNVIVTQTCKCLNTNDTTCDPGSQWFKIIDSTRTTKITKSFLQIKPIIQFLARNFFGSYI
uniref:Glycoside hydrolase family 5 domain-containing protein n=1 Tax=Solanum lycopersicum TaxID=4081 RepID=A0A3Q7GFA8_SOLLC|nr:glycosyl hydrolase 5 family protein [Solanum lycopersicum]